MNGEVQPVTSRLIYTKKKTIYLNILTWDGLPTWISEEAKRAVFRSITNALTTNVLQLVTPVIVATQLQMNIRDLHEVHTIFLRAMPRYQGIVAQDCVNVSFIVSFIRGQGQGQGLGSSSSFSVFSQSAIRVRVSPVQCTVRSSSSLNLRLRSSV